MQLEGGRSAYHPTLGHCVLLSTGPRAAGQAGWLFTCTEIVSWDALLPLPPHINPFWAQGSTPNPLLCRVFSIAPALKDVLGQPQYVSF